MKDALRRRRRLVPLVVVVALAAVAATVVGVVRAQTTAPPVNTAAPIILGSFQQGQTLSALPGAWTNSPTNFAYEWESCDPVGPVCELRWTGTTYTLLPEDVGNVIRLGIVASNSAGSSPEALSAVSGVVVASGAPVNVGAPTISGPVPPQQGEQLSAQNGTWINATGFEYQWLNCDAEGNNCAPISGATNANYTPQPSDVGDTLRVLVQAASAGPPVGSAHAVSAQTQVVQGPGPVNTSPPTITGTAAFGNTLTATTGNWTSPNGSPITYAYQWQRGNAQAQNFQNIPGATQQTYTIQQADVGNTLRVVVTATNNQGSQSANSNPTAVVQGAPPAGQTIPVSQVLLSEGNRLVISSVDYTPNVLRSRAPFELTVQVKDVFGNLVQGAVVDFTPVPFERVLPPQSVTTNQNGLATVTLQPTAKFPLIPGYRIVVFVRATKPGDNIVAGVTGLRLTSVRINPR